MVSKSPWWLLAGLSSIAAAGCDAVGDVGERGPAVVVGDADDELARVCEASALDLCASECVDLAVDPRHCGGCGRVCAGACAVGYCEAPCEPGQLRCDGECVDRTRVVPGGDQRVFEFSGAPEIFVVPACVSQITIELWGAQGGGSRCCDGALQDDGGRGAWVRAQLDVEPGEALQIVVGGAGEREGPGGYNGGGAGGEFSGGGGGATDVRRGGSSLDERILVAAGGGGGQCGCPDHGEGGAGGTELGGAGVGALPEWQAGAGGSQSDGGPAGTSPGQAGEFGAGGGGGTYHVAGGGAGWFGGGSAYGAGGGGGSSYLGDHPDTTGQSGLRAGDGQVTIRW